MFDYGSFLKSSIFKYEHETRIKLHMHSSEHSVQGLANQFFDDNFYLDDEDMLIDRSINYINKHKKRLNEVFNEAKDKIKIIGGKKSFELNVSNTSVDKLVDCIFIHCNATKNERECVYKLAQNRNVPIKELDFDNISKNICLKRT